MTDHEVFLREQEQAWERNRQAWAEHEAFVRKYDAQCAQDRQDRKALDARIEKLVSGIGEFMRRGDAPAKP
jgi:hypothetical protein